jgi:hypothetical protein
VVVGGLTKFHLAWSRSAQRASELPVKDAADKPRLFETKKSRGHWEHCGRHAACGGFFLKTFQEEIRDEAGGPAALHSMLS